MQIDWDGLNTFADWSGALDRILAQATEALQAGDAAQRVEASELLLEFVRNSPDATAAQLEVIAKAAMDDLAGKAVGEALASLSARTAELALHSKVINAIAEDNELKARSIRLDKARQVIDATAGIVVTLTELRQTLRDSADDLAVAAKIDRAVKAIHDLVPFVMKVKG